MNFLAPAAAGASPYLKKLASWLLARVQQLFASPAEAAPQPVPQQPQVDNWDEERVQFADLERLKAGQSSVPADWKSTSGDSPSRS